MQAVTFYFCSQKCTNNNFLKQCETISQQYLSCLAVVQSKVVAGLQVEGNGGVRDALKVHSQNLLRHIIVVQLVVTQSHIHFEGQEISE